MRSYPRRRLPPHVPDSFPIRAIRRYPRRSPDRLRGLTASSRARGVFQRVPQLRPRGDAELREEPVQVRLHRSVREIEALTDLPIREALCGELGDLKPLRRQLRPAARNASANGLAGGTQFPASPLGVPEQAE